MRVTWMTPWYPWPGDPIRGAFHQTQARAIAALGVEVGVVAPRPGTPFPLRHLGRRWAGYARLPRHGSDGDITVARPPYLAVPGEPGWARPSDAIARAALRELRGSPRPDLVHGHFVVPTGMAARRVAADLGVPYVLTVHGYDATSWPDDHAGDLGEYRRTLQEAAAVITVADALGRRIRELAGVETVTLPLGVDHGLLRSLAVPRSVARGRLGIADETPVVLFVGRATAHKGVRELAEALGQLGEEAIGVVAGDGPLQGHRPDVLRHLGPLDRPGVVEAMCAADMLVLPSYQEGLPTVLVEAGSLGLPVIATAVDGTPELLADGRGLLIPPRDPGAIAKAVRAVIADPAAAAERTARLRAHVDARFDATVNAGALVALYERVLGGGRP